MPQISEVQCIYWSSLHPSPVALLPNAINTLAGPNGSCKTSFMDAVKVIFGIRKLFEDRSPHDYVYEDPVAGTSAAPHAIVKVTFCNPADDRGRRPFALIAPGMDSSDFATAVCRIQRNSRREYVLLAGLLDWTDSNAIEPDLYRIRHDRLGTGFLSPDEWNERVLRRIGVTRAMQSVLAIDQFETASLTRKKPEELLDAILQIAGEQATRQKYNEARAALATSEQELTDANRRLQEEELRLKELEYKRNRHLQYEKTLRQMLDLRKRERYARWRDADKQQADHLHEIELQVQKCSASSAKLKEIAGSKQMIQEQTSVLSDQLESTRAEYKELDLALRSAERRKATLSQQAENQRKEIDRFERLPQLDIDSLLRSETELQNQVRNAVVQVSKLHEELTDLDRQISELQRGHAPKPAGLELFLAELECRGLHPAVLGEHLRYSSRETLELAAVALGHHAWAIAVDSAGWYEAKQIAAQNGIHCELVSDQDHAQNSPVSTNQRSILANCTVDDKRFVSALHLWGIDATQAVSGWEEGHTSIADGAELAVSPDGVLQAKCEAQFGRDRSLLTFSIEEQLRKSVERRVEIWGDYESAIEKQGNLEGELGGLRDSIREQHEKGQLPGTRAVLNEVEVEHRSVCEQLTSLEKQRNRAQEECEQIRVRLTELKSQHSQLEKDEKQVGEQIRAAESRQAEFKERLQAAQNVLLQINLVPEEQQKARAEAELVDTLQAQAGAAEETLGSFEEDVRGPAVLADYDSQEVRVGTIRNLVGGKQGDARRAHDLCERARADYHEYLKRFSERLAASFRETCADCGADGELSIRGLTEDRPYLHVAVAHNRGERLVAYREAPHSGGQRAKISMLLLIAAMGLDGGADFMLLDEPTAHMSGNVIRQVNQLLDNLVHNRGRHVQFIFAVPTKAEKELGALLADQQILFFLRRPGESFNPPVLRVIREEVGVGASA